MKYNIKTIMFVRWGGLSPVKQKGYRKPSKILDFNKPPSRKGIYAFVWPLIDKEYLMYHKESCLKKNSNNHMYTKDGKLQKPRKFRYVGLIWHHLEGFLKDKNQILYKKGSWVKTSMEDYILALNKAIHLSIREFRQDCEEFNVGSEVPKIHYKVKPWEVIEAEGICEVFIDGKI